MVTHREFNSSLSCNNLLSIPLKLKLTTFFLSSPLFGYWLCLQHGHFTSLNISATKQWSSTIPHICIPMVFKPFIYDFVSTAYMLNFVPHGTMAIGFFTMLLPLLLQHQFSRLICILSSNIACYIYDNVDTLPRECTVQVP